MLPPGISSVLEEPLACTIVSLSERFVVVGGRICRGQPCLDLIVVLSSGKFLDGLIDYSLISYTEKEGLSSPTPIENLCHLPS